MKRKSTEISEEEIVEYLVKKSQKKATGVFVWKKKIERDISQRLPPVLDMLMSPEIQRERIKEIEKLKKKRDERSLEKVRREEERALFARERARAEFQEWEKKEDEFDFQQRKFRSENKLREEHEAVDRVEDMAMLERERMKPKYFSRVHSGYEWNKYNHTHYDHDNPPPKSVQGYKFDIFYPDLMDKSKAPTYVIEKDGSNSDACIIRFRAGPPYEDIAFRIPNKDWDFSAKKMGFKCTCERGVLRLYFNYKRQCYRR